MCMLKINEKLITNSIYSTEEQKIGKWINGESLYRKVLYYSGIIANGSSAGVGTIDNVDKIINARGFCKSGNTQIPIPESHISSINSQIEIWFGGNTLTVATGSARNISEIRMVVEYTKTTD